VWAASKQQQAPGTLPSVPSTNSLLDPSQQLEELTQQRKSNDSRKLSTDRKLSSDLSITGSQEKGAGLWSSSVGVHKRPDQQQPAGCGADSPPCLRCLPYKVRACAAATAAPAAAAAAAAVLTESERARRERQQRCHRLSCQVPAWQQCGLRLGQLLLRGLTFQGPQPLAPFDSVTSLLTPSPLPPVHCVPVTLVVPAGCHGHFEALPQHRHHLCAAVHGADDRRGDWGHVHRSQRNTPAQAVGRR
jgi:hypothetical protein